MMQKIKEIKSKFNKINNRNGESLAETMVAALIGGLALMMLAQMLTAASGMIRSSQEAMNTYIAGENTLNTLNADGTSTETGTVQFAVINADGSTRSTNIASGNSFHVSYYTNGEVISYEKQ